MNLIATGVDNTGATGQNEQLKAPFSPVLFRGTCINGYSVSVEGMVWSDRSSLCLKPWAVGGGYLMVGMRHKGRTIRAYIHQIVAETFIGPRPFGLDVCHNDGIRTHNTAKNLRYASRAKNLSDREAHGTSQRGERNPSAKLSDAQANEVRERRAEGVPLRVLAAKFGVRESAISRIANGKRRAVQ